MISLIVFAKEIEDLRLNLILVKVAISSFNGYLELYLYNVNKLLIWQYNDIYTDNILTIIRIF